MGLVGMHFVRSQCFCPTLNGVTLKQSFSIFVDIHFENAAVLRVDVVVCRLSMVCLIADVLLAERAGSCSTERDAQQRLLSPT